MVAQMTTLQAKAETGIAANPMKFAEQEKKRKMLWQGKREDDKSQSGIHNMGKTEFWKQGPKCQIQETDGY